MTLRRPCSLALAALCLVAGAPAAAASGPTTLWVAGADPACSDSGAATSSQPLCTVSAAAGRAVAGDTVVVRDGTYRETLKPARSGTAASPITFVAEGSGAVLLGSRDLSDPALWAAAGGGAWSTSYSKDPKQVLLDGSRLARSTSSSVGAGQWFWDSSARRLYLNTDGSNPGYGHSVEASWLTYGVVVSGHDHVVVRGFVTRNQRGYGVSVQSGAASVVVSGMDVAMAGSAGIRCYDCGAGFEATGNEVSRNLSTGLQVRDSTRALVQDNTAHHNGNHGISLQGTTHSLVSRNTSYGNARPTTRAAVGIDVSASSSDNVVEDNVARDNQDSGIQVYSASNRNLVRRNVSYRNGDHGLDTLRSTGTRYVSNTVFGNTRDGISVEGSSTGTSVVNCITADNGGYDLWVDTGSYSGFSSDYDVIWRARSGYPIKVNGQTYESVRAFAAATGHESAGSGAQPRFVSAATGDFRPASGSPAIDSATASAADVRLTDANGVGPYDDPATPDVGAGTPAYLDRGAYEYQP